MMWFLFIVLISDKTAKDYQTHTQIPAYLLSYTMTTIKNVTRIKHNEIYNIRKYEKTIMHDHLCIIGTQFCKSQDTSTAG